MKKNNLLSFLSFYKLFAIVFVVTFGLIASAEVNINFSATGSGNKIYINLDSSVPTEFDMSISSCSDKKLEFETDSGDEINCEKGTLRNLELGDMELIAKNLKEKSEITFLVRYHIPDYWNSLTHKKESFSPNRGTMYRKVTIEPSNKSQNTTSSSNRENSLGDFEETGYLTLHPSGLWTGDWYLVYEKIGGHNSNVTLLFDERTDFDFCSTSPLKEGNKVKISGYKFKYEDVVKVEEMECLIDDSEDNRQNTTNSENQTHSKINKLNIVKNRFGEDSEMYKFVEFLMGLKII
jgi:hypothetical protein